MEDFVQQWNNVVAYLKKNSFAVGTSIWLGEIVCFHATSAALYLRVPNILIKSIIETRYFVSIEQATRAATQRDISVLFFTPEESEEVLRDIEKPIEPINTPSINHKYTFETFIVGSNNRFAHAASLGVAELPAHKHNPLFIYGGPGLGKTHLLHAIGNRLLTEHRNLRVLYVASESFTNDLIHAIRTNANDAFRAKYRNVDCLLIDDIQFIIGKEATQEEVFHTFNTLYEANKQIVFSSDRPPRDFITLEERYRSRFEMGLTADIMPPDIETRVAILRNKAINERLNIDDSAIQYIADNIQSNIRELEGALNRVMHMASIYGVQADTKVAMEALSYTQAQAPQRIITPEVIMRTVCAQYSISMDDFTSKKRNSDIAIPRQYAMYLMREILGLSFPKIGELFGGRDHTTIMHGYNKIMLDLKTDDKLQTVIADIRYMIEKGEK